MRSIISFLTAGIIAIAADRVYAQEYYQHDTTVKVYAYGHELTIPWCGGFNNPEFGMADLNHDGVQDLVTFERGLGVSTFINTGTESGLPVYRYAPQYALNFPSVNSYMYLLDYNCDGIADLFERGPDGIAAHKGYYNAGNQLCFSFYRSLYYYNDLTAGGPSQAFVNPSDIPGIADVDGDGDLDFVSYYITGGYMYLHRNMRVEDGLPCDSIRVKLVDRCWGKVYQGFYREHSLGYTCSNSGLLRESGKKTHPGNTICLFDWDNDGDVEYLNGSVSWNEMTFIRNGKADFTYPIDTLVEQDTLWQTAGKKVSMLSWPAAFNVDVNQDGKKDLLISPNSGNGSDNYNCIWYYKNNTTSGTPDWQFQSDTFLVDRTIDVGSGSYPVLFDYNKDGKQDLIVGADGYRNADGTLTARMSLYVNTSTPGNPSFTLETKDLSGISSYNFQGAAPAVGDIDGDGKKDLLLGHTNGRLSYFKNMAASDDVIPDWQLVQLELTDENGTVIDLTGNAAPFIYDVDKDGKPDLLIGSIFGYVSYYRNVSVTPGTIRLKLINVKLGSAKADPVQNFGIYSTPFVGKIDPSGTEYLLLGSNSGNIYQFDGIGSGDTTMTYTLIDGQYAWIDSTYNVYSHPAYGIYNNRRSAVTVGDIDGSGNYVLIKGNIRGGLEIYKRKVYDAQVPTYTSGASISVYPNPAGDFLNISWKGIHDSEVRELQVSVIDMTGRECMSRTAPVLYNNTQLMTRSLPAGMYICVVHAGAERFYSKFTILH